MQWFNGETHDKLTNGLQDLHDLILQTHDKKSFEFLSQFLKNTFAKFSQTSFLLVIDNLIEESSSKMHGKNDKWIETFLVNMPENVHVLITCRNSNCLSEFSLLEEQAKKLSVEYFTENQAHTFFKEHSKREFDQEEKVSLDRYFSENQVLPYDINLLVSILNKNRLLKLNNFFVGYPDLCDRIFKELYEIIYNQSKDAWLALEFMSLIDPDAIPIFLLMSFFEKNDPVYFQNIINILESNGVVEFNEKDYCLKMHRRTQEKVKKYVLNNEKRKEIELRVAETVVTEMPHINEYPDEDWQKAKILFNHVLTIENSEYLEEEKEEEKSEIKAELNVKMGIFYYQMIGDDDKALIYFTRVINWFEKKLSDCIGANCNLSIIYSYVGLIHKRKGKLDLAIEYQQKVLKMIEEFYPDKKDLSLAAAYNNIGNTYSEKGLFDLSLKYHIKSLKIRKNLFPDEKHESVAKAYDNLGNLFEDQSLFKRAAQYKLKALKIRESLFSDKKHPSLASSYGGLAFTFYRMDLLDLSIEYDLKGIQIREEFYPEKTSPELLNSYTNIGCTYFHKGLLDQALEYQLKALKHAEDLCLDEKKSILYNSIARTYKHKGFLDIAQEYQQKEINLQKALWNKNNNSGFMFYWSNID